MQKITATLFNFEDTVVVATDDLSLRLNFELLEGEGSFCGHITKGNRPSELMLRQKELCHPYDRCIFLRTVNRKGSCKIKINIVIK